MQIRKLLAASRPEHGVVMKHIKLLPPIPRITRNIYAVGWNYLEHFAEGEAMRVTKKLSDYKKQKVPAGVYTLRLEKQPMDGDHMGTAPYSEFLLVCKAAEDKDPGPMKPKALHDLSGNVTEGHPGVFLLYPGTGATSQPKVVSKEGGAWVLLYQAGAAGGQKAVLPIGLTLVGASEAA